MSDKITKPASSAANFTAKNTFAQAADTAGGPQKDTGILTMPPPSALGQTVARLVAWAIWRGQPSPPPDLSRKAAMRVSAIVLMALRFAITVIANTLKFE